MPDPVTPLSLIKDFGVPIVSAVLGALLAYVPAARLAKHASADALHRDRAQRRESELTQARRAFVKLTLLANSLGSYNKHVEAMIAKADDDGNGHMPIWQRVSTFAGIEDERSITFDASELEPFIAAKRPDVVDHLLLLQRRHTAVIYGLRAFARQKEELHYMIAGRGSVTRDDNLVATIRATIPTDIANLYRAKASELDVFTAAIRAQIGEYARYAEGVAARFEEASSGYFGSGMLPSLEPIADDNLASFDDSRAAI